MTQSGPDAPAQSVGRVARLSGNVRQPNHVLANEIAGHKAERRPRAGEEWLAATKYDGVAVKSILIPLSVLLDSSHTIPRLGEPDEHLRVVSRDDQSRVGRELLHPVLRSQV